MAGERRNQIILIVFLAVVLGLATLATMIRVSAQRTADPGFADYSLQIEADASADLEVDAAREVESINAGAFRPFIVGESRER